MISAFKTKFFKQLGEKKDTMKKFVQFLILLISFNSFAQIEATILKKNGEVLKGFASVSQRNSNVVKFRKKINDKPQYFGRRDFDKIFFKFNEDSFIEYQFKSISKKNTQLMKVLIKDHLSLYSFTNTIVFNTHSSGKGFGNINIGKIRTTTTFYLSKNNNNIVEKFPSKTVFKSFKKNASTYFKNCIELVEKINKKEFKKANAIEIVEFYNKKCN